MSKNGITGKKKKERKMEVEKGLPEENGVFEVCLGWDFLFIYLFERDILF